MGIICTLLTIKPKPKSKQSSQNNVSKHFSLETHYSRPISTCSSAVANPSKPNVEYIYRPIDSAPNYSKINNTNSQSSRSLYTPSTDATQTSSSNSCYSSYFVNTPDIVGNPSYDYDTYNNRTLHHHHHNHHNNHNTSQTSNHSHHHNHNHHNTSQTSDHHSNTNPYHNDISSNNHHDTSHFVDMGSDHHS